MRNFLFVPGNSPKMLSSANFLGSDAIIIDLEDAVPLSEKDAARILVRNAMEALRYDVTVGVRINSLSTKWWKKDIEALKNLPVDYIMLPKTERASDIQMLTSQLEGLGYHRKSGASTKIIALIETACGMENAYEIACSSEEVEALFLGAEDLTADLHAVRTKESRELVYSRGRIVNAARAAGKDVYDTPFTDIADEAGLLSDAKLAKTLGFTGKACINPGQISAVNEVFTPESTEIEYAQAVIDAAAEGERLGLGAVSLNGKMIDAPIITRAKAVLALAAQIGGDAL